MNEENSNSTPCSAYLCVQGGTNRELSDRVNAAIQEGFQPYGNPISHRSYIVQSMTRTEQNPTGQKPPTENDQEQRINTAQNPVTSSK